MVVVLCGGVAGHKKRGVNVSVSESINVLAKLSLTNSTFALPPCVATMNNPILM